MGKSAIPPELVEATAREREALTLRRAGCSYRSIGDKLGVTHEGARQAVKRAMDRLVKLCNEEAAELRILEAQRLDAMHEALWDKATSGDVQAVDRVLKIMERRARLFGLDGAEVHAIVDASEKQQVIDRLMEMLRRKRAAYDAETAPGAVA